MNRFIRSQGDLDGACFLYAVFNSVQALLHKKESKAAWARMISTSMSPVDYLAGRGTASIDKQDELISHLITAHINAVGHNVTTKLIQAPTSKLLSKMIDQQSVLLLDNGVHWFCVVESTENTAYIACSAVWQENPQSYSEERSPRFKRHFNDKISSSELEYFRNRAYLVSRINSPPV